MARGGARMKKIRTLIIAVLLIILFVPWINVSYEDGGTKEHAAVLYKVVEWRRMMDDGDDYVQTRVYWGLERFKSLDKLWLEESENVEYSFVATVLEVSGDSILVEPMEGEEELYSSDQITFNGKGMNEEVEVGSVVKVTYKGSIMESCPAKINALSCEIITGGI